MTKVIRWRGFQEFWFLCTEQQAIEDELEVLGPSDVVEVSQELLDQYKFGIAVIRDVFNQLPEEIKQ